LITQAIAHGQEGKDEALMLICQAIPCIIHLENQVGKKLIMVLLARAAENFQNRGTTLNFSTQSTQTFQHIMNTRILGIVTRPKQWKVLLNLGNDGVTKVAVSNTKTRFLCKISLPWLIILFFPAPADAELKDILHMMLQNYSNAMKII
jgi:hypothetical protein